MKKTIFSGLFVLTIAALAAFNVNMNIENDKTKLLSLAGIEAFAENEIDYQVPHKNNNPQKCTMYVDARGNVYADKNGAGVSASLTKVTGMQNFCEDAKWNAHGCNPYNCHQRVY